MGGNQSTTNSESANNSQTSTELSSNRLTFHDNCGKNVQLSRNKEIAKRVNSFCYGIAFSSRPVEINEVVHLKLQNVQKLWSGVMRLGVTSNNPSRIYFELPRYACPELTNKPGYWAKAISEDFCVQDYIISFCINDQGELLICVNGDNKGVLLENIPISFPLWVMVDIYGNTCGLQFVDEPPFNIEINPPQQGDFAAEQSDSIQNSSNSEAEIDDVHSENENIEELNHPLQEDRSSEIEGAVDDEESDVNSLYEEVIEDGEDADHHDLDPDLLHFLRARSITQLSLRGFSSSHGCGVVIENRRVARQINPLSRQISLVFLDGPLCAGRTLHFQILASSARSNLCVGVTSCNPDSIDVNFLPADPNELVDREEYWVVRRIRNAVGQGDYFSLSIQSDGLVRYQINNDPPRNLFFCDITQNLWVLIDLDDFIEEIRLIGETRGSLSTNDASHSRQVNSWDFDDQPPETSSTMRSNPSQPCQTAESGSTNSEEYFNLTDSNNDFLGFLNQRFRPLALNPNRSDSSSSDEFVLSETISRVEASSNNHANILRVNNSEDHTSTSLLQPVDGSIDSRVKPAVDISMSRVFDSPPSSSVANSEPQESSSSGAAPSTNPGHNECSICLCEKADTAILDCGHVCVCYDCGSNLQGRNRYPLCPICRKPILKIVKLYYS